MVKSEMERSSLAMRQNRIGRRELLAGGGLIAASGGLFGSGSPPSSAGATIYEKLAVRPLINCKGTFTIISGSLTLPEVKRAMDEASRHYVHLDELMEAVGERLAQLTGAESGIVTAGCSAAETLATCACIAGTNPENINRLPNLEGLKDEVIIPRYSRNVYDHAVRMVGVKIVTVEDVEELKAALGPRTAMIYVLACPDDRGPLGLETIAREAGKSGVPVFVDAAAENLTPEIHLDRGADLVAYSGGKAIRGPQCAGLLLGRRDLVQAAWMNSAPHHGFGRSSKVGKEEIMGMLTAVETWYARDHEAEWKTWESWLEVIARRMRRLAGVQTRVIQPESLSNHSPRLRIEWDGTRLGIGGQEVYDALLNGDPRIILARGTGGDLQGLKESSVEVMPWMMEPGNAETVAESLSQVLSNPPKVSRPQQIVERPADIGGHWDMQIEFTLGSDDHKLVLEQRGSQVSGLHVGRTLSGDVLGKVEGNQVDLRSSQVWEGARLQFRFTGSVQNDLLEGIVELGEYGEARWIARRHSYHSRRS